MSSGERTRVLLVQVLKDSGRFRPLTKMKAQVTLLCALFEVDEDDEPWESRIREGVKGRAGPTTESKLRERAESLGLLKRTTGEPARDDESYLDRLRATRDRISRIDPEFTVVEAAALDWAIGKLSRRP